MKTATGIDLSQCQFAFESINVKVHLFARGADHIHCCYNLTWCKSARNIVDMCNDLIKSLISILYLYSIQRKFELKGRCYFMDMYVRIISTNNKCTQKPDIENSCKCSRGTLEKLDVKLKKKAGGGVKMGGS